MSCWVVPAVAASYWGVATDEVLRRVERNEVISKREMGFLLIDVAPHQPNRTLGRLPPDQRPPTWRPAEDAVPSEPPASPPDHERRDEKARYAERVLRITQAVADGDWRTTRRLVREVRTPPAARAA